MDVPQHILRSLFRDTSFPLIQHHVDSYNAALEASIPNFIRASNPHELELPDGRFIRVFIGGRDASKLKWMSPVDEIGNALLPHACRLDDQTYAVTLTADLEVEYVIPGHPNIVREFKDVVVGKIPLMLRSRMCYLTGMDGYEVGECKFELGGYFVIDGAEKVLLTQEKLGNNMMYSGKRKQAPPKEQISRAAEKAKPLELEGDVNVESSSEFYTGIRSVSEDASRGPYSHFLVIPDRNVYEESAKRGGGPPNFGQHNRVASITLPGFSQPVPLISVFRALGCASDRDIYEIVLFDVVASQRTVYDDLLTTLIMSHESFLRREESTDLDILKKLTHTRSRAEVVRNLHEMVFPHVEGSEDTGSLFRRKAYQLGLMFRNTMDVILERKPPSDRDHFQYKRLETSGDLCFGEFRRIFRDLSKTMLLELDKKVNQFERASYTGTNLANVFQPETLGFFWKPYRMLNEFLKSFKGAWGGRDGIAQELSRMSYVGVVSHLRRTNLAMDRTSNKPEPRRYHGSQFGLMCPVDSPDGRNIGYIKGLAVMAQISTAFPSTTVRMLLTESKLIRPLEDIHPSSWDPRWTPVFLNSDLVGACIGNTMVLVAMLVEARRNGRLSRSVSIGWSPVNNLLRITCDSGRPIRPVYREGVTDDMMRTSKSWTDILTRLDYVDALESDCSRFSWTPFHPTLRSEIHMSFNLSALTNLTPFADHNPGTRNAFAIAQTKQTASWYHTNYTKRFDTIALMAVLPQKPLTQTWMYREMMGPGGCMAYGENAMVAITTYGGYNQEDSVMMNGTSMKRGMFQTVYFHSYKMEEDMIDPAMQLHTEITNVLRKENVKRKDDGDYEHLDADGLVKVGTEVTGKTVLVGVVAPVVDVTGHVTGYRDVSMMPKRDQRGRVDAVYRFSTQEGLRGIKIRIVEERYPVLGDKMGSRHSQKGTVGMILPEEDMPFTARGLRPDIIFNPHAMPTRMTIGQWMESSYSRLALKQGAFIDATPCTTTDRVKTLKGILATQGFEPFGSEILYNGMTGEQMEVDIFMGPTYYQRMKHMVEDKINYRATGPRKAMTHQPLEGRSDEGGMRVGEMERDALVAHGMSKFLTESFMERSDKTEVLFNRESKTLDTSRDHLEMPYAMFLYARELESMHITVQLKTE
jgi:DNA-directed RNA polymerase II subunit RPB2